MRAVSVTCKTLMWIVLVISTGFALLAMWGIGQGNQDLIAAGQSEDVYNLWPLALTFVLLWAGVLLYTLLRKMPLIGLIITIVAGIAAVLIALDLGRAFPPQIGATREVGLSTVKIIYRHISPVLVPVLLIPAFFCDRTLRRLELERLEKEAGHHFDLSGGPLFIDVEVDSSDALAGTARREKRSVRIARRKQKAPEAE